MVWHHFFHTVIYPGYFEQTGIDWRKNVLFIWTFSICNLFNSLRFKKISISNFFLLEINCPSGKCLIVLLPAYLILSWIHKLPPPINQSYVDKQEEIIVTAGLLDIPGKGRISDGKSMLCSLLFDVYQWHRHIYPLDQGLSLNLDHSSWVTGPGSPIPCWPCCTPARKGCVCV